MSSVVSAVSDVVGDAFDAVGDVVEDVGGIVTDVADTVGKTVENTIDAAMSDPIGTTLKVAAVATGNAWAVPLISGAETVARGGSMEDALTNAAISYVAAEVGGNVATGTESSIAGGAAAGATGSTLHGGDPLSGAISGGLNAATGSAAKSISDQQFEDWAKEQASNTYDNAYSPTEQDVLAADPSIQMDFPLSTPTDATGPGYYDEITGAFVPAENGGLTAPLTDASGTNYDSMDGYSYDPETNTWTDPSGTVTDLSELSNSQEPLDTSAVLPEATDLPAEEYDPVSKDLIKEGLDLAKAGLLSGSGAAGVGTTGTVTGGTVPTDTTAADATNATQPTSGKVNAASDPSQLNPLLYKLFNTPQAKTTADPFSDIALGTTSFAPRAAAPESTAPAPESFAQGGLASMHPAGEPEFYSEGGLNNRYIKGEGDGTSDSIPAMVADSEFVMPADVVAALGNGSSDAGASKLDQMVQAIRKRARSTHPSELPPTAHESPLDYLKGRA